MITHVIKALLIKHFVSLRKIYTATISHKNHIIITNLISLSVDKKANVNFPKKMSNFIKCHYLNGN